MLLFGAKIIGKGGVFGLCYDLMGQELNVF